jgi:glycosyltransferase involved in cell wall biosynthesis
VFKLKNLVSIIIPVYNCEEYLEQCLTSIVNQTYNNIEIIIVDDGSTDSSLSIIKKHAIIDERIKYITQKNMGQSKARNVGLLLSSGEYVTFVDADDWVDSSFVEKMWNQIIKDGTDIAICMHTVHTPKNFREVLSSVEGKMASETIFKYMLNDYISHVCWAKLYKADIIRKSGYLFPEDKTHEDIYIVSIWILNSKDISILNESLYNVRTRNGSLTNSFSEKSIDLIEILDMLSKYLEQKNIFKIFELDFSRKYQNLIVYLVNYGARFGNKNFAKRVIAESKFCNSDLNIGRVNLKWRILLAIYKRNVWAYYYIMQLYYKLRDNKEGL